MKSRGIQYGLVLALTALVSPYVQPVCAAGPALAATSDEEAKALIDAEAALLQKLEKTAAETGTPSVKLIEVAASTPAKPIEAAPETKAMVRQNFVEVPAMDGERSEVVPAPEMQQKLAKLQSENESLHTRVKNQEGSLSQLQKKRAGVESQLASAKRKIEKLSKELDDAQGRLLIAETEVERLSRVIEVRSVQGKIPSTPRTSRTRVSELPAGGAGDMMIATVSADKVNLRTGPGLENSPLMTVAEGTRLAVETREGSWYRVIAPTGARAWVSSEVVTFGPDPDASPTRTVKVRGVSEESEENAYRFIKSIAR